MCPSKEGRASTYLLIAYVSIRIAMLETRNLLLVKYYQPEMAGMKGLFGFGEFFQWLLPPSSKLHPPPPKKKTHPT